MDRVRRGRSLCDKSQLEVADDAVHHGIIGEEGDDAHLAAALRANHRIYFIHLPYHLCPAPSGNPRAFLLDDEEILVGLALLHFAPVGISIQAEITDGDMAFVGNMRGNPCYELQIIHMLQLLSSFPIPVAGFTFSFIEGEAFQGKERTNHVFSHALGLFFGLDFDLAVDREAHVVPAEDLLDKRKADQPFLEKQGEDLLGEDLLLIAGEEVLIPFPSSSFLYQKLFP
jgi:hypothetical protein